MNNFTFTSTSGVVSQQDLEKSFWLLYLRSPAFREKVNDLRDMGENIEIKITNGSPADPTPDYALRPDIYGATTKTDPINNPHDTLILFSEQYLEEINYITNYQTGENRATSLERVIAHEVMHSWQLANSIPEDGAHEQAAAELENQIMFEAWGEAPRVGDPLSARPNYDGSTMLVCAPHDIESHSVLYGTHSDFIETIQTLFTRAENDRPDPLVLDLNGNNTIDLNTEHTVYFDTDNDGFAEAVNWVAATDGLLARDVNNNGNIDNNNELFGSAAVDGFSVLATYDLNSDDVINASDSVWADLVVWQDLNQDGYSQSDELLSLASLGITSIDLGSVVANTTDPGVTHDSTITTTSGTMRISNVLFDADFVNTRYVGDYTLDIDTLFLPTLRGHGTVMDLHIASSMNTSTDANGHTIKDKLVELVANDNENIWERRNVRKIVG